MIARPKSQERKDVIRLVRVHTAQCVDDLRHAGNIGGALAVKVLMKTLVKEIRALHDWEDNK